jgi:hypothetical protein
VPGSFEPNFLQTEPGRIFQIKFWFKPPVMDKIFFRGEIFTCKKIDLGSRPKTSRSDLFAATNKWAVNVQIKDKQKGRKGQPNDSCESGRGNLASWQQAIFWTPCHSVAQTMIEGE